MCYKVKQTKEGRIDKYKARLCARGDWQTFGVEFDETFAPVVRFATIRLILALCSIMDWVVWQLDINSAYLYGKIDRDINMENSRWFLCERKESRMRIEVAAGLIWTETGRKNLV